MFRNTREIRTGLMLAIMLLVAAAARQSFAETYVCPPCGGACDTLVFNTAGNCTCGMRLVQAEHTEQSGDGSQTALYSCPPCGNSCDTLGFSGPGTCPGCGMALINAAPVTKWLKVAIVLYNGVELLDFAGPGEVFQAAGNFTDADDGGIQAFTVSADGAPITSQGFVTIDPEYSIADCPAPDIIVLPGGGVRSVIDNPSMMAWIGKAAPQARHCMTVCTGAFILAKAGLLDGLEATTWYNAVERFRQRYPKVKVRGDSRWIDNGRYVTTAGVSAGIDGALHIVSRLFGENVARKTAQYMEYDKWDPGAGRQSSASDHDGY